MRTDTIAAIATGMGSAGIGIIRISGDQAFEIIQKIFVPAKKIKEKKNREFHYGHIYDGKEKVDEVMILWMKGPHSYTAEDSVEIDCHGGVLMMKKILETVIKYGARPAEPGEFTKRAFLNGRIDLSQAEAVIDVINAKNDYALKSSITQLSGAVSEKIQNIREKILYHIAYIESALDDPEHISLDGYSEKLSGDIKPIILEIEKLIKSSDNGRIMTEGIKTVILGRPNVGKSSLLNMLLGEERAIVTDVAGTTRDTLEEHIRMNGISLNVIDTAGIRETEDIVEKIGVDRARLAADEADLIIYVIDSSSDLDENDSHIIDIIRYKKAIVILNKTDLKSVMAEKEISVLTGHDVVSISAKTGDGIERLEEKIKAMFYEGKIDFNDEVYITNVRQKTALTESLSSLNMVKDSIENKMPEDFYSIDLLNAYERLGSIIGEAVEEDVVNEIFSRFCMGK